MQTTDSHPIATPAAIYGPKPNAGPNPGPGPGPTEPIEFIELSLAVDLLLESHPVFAEAVKAALLPLDGELLFDLPFAAAPDGKGRVAAVRLAYAGATERRLAFVFLSDDAMDARVSPPGEDVAHLRSFAESFVGVLEKMGH